MPRGSSCKAKGCTSTKNHNPELSFHSFPRNEERFKLWCDLIKRPDLNHRKVMARSTRVCSLHFEDQMYMNPINKSRLIWSAVPKPLEIKASETGEIAPSDHLLPEPEASEKIEAYSPCAEDITIKEENDMDQDFNDDFSVPSCCFHEISAVEFSVDTKEGILDQSQSGQVVKERVESESFEDDPESCQTSSTKSNTLGCVSQSSSQREGMSHQSPICSSNSFAIAVNTPSNSASVFQESPSYQSKSSNSDSTGPIADSISINKDLDEKSNVDMETTYETISGKNECSEACGCDKCLAAEEMKKKTGAMKSIIQRTYSGPIRRQVVRTKNGGKSTIMIVNKASLKNLQAKGIIKPLTTKYMVNHPHALQSLKKKIIPYISASADGPSNDHLEFLQSENFLPLIEADSSRKSLSVQVHPSTDENCIRKFSKESRDESYTSSHTFQTPKSQTTNIDSQAPVSVSWAPVNESDASSFTFTVTSPTEVSRPAGTSHDPPQIATSMLNNGAQCTINQPNSQAIDSLDSQSSSNSGTSPYPRSKGSKESVSGPSIISGLTCLDPVQINTSVVSSKYVFPSPVVSTHVPSKKTDIYSNSCSSRTTSQTRNASTATPIHKHPNPKPIYVTIPDLSFEVSSKEKSHCSKNPEGKIEEDQPTKTRPKDRDSVQWIAFPSAHVHQPQRSSSGAPKQIQQTSQRSNTASSEQSSAGYGAYPTASLDERGKRLVLPSFYRSANKELKVRYARLINKHRRKYYLLLKKYKILEEKFSAVKDVGTPKQVMRDARKFLSEEHVFFLESQMFLKNRSGTGNRFSRKFKKLMIEYYNRSAAGYRFLRKIFILPSVSTVQAWLKKAVELGDLDEDSSEDYKEDSVTGNEKDDHLLHKIKPANICHDSNSSRIFSQPSGSAQNLEYEANSVDHHDSEESDLEEMEAEKAEHC